MAGADIAKRVARLEANQGRRAMQVDIQERPADPVRAFLADLGDVGVSRLLEDIWRNGKRLVT